MSAPDGRAPAVDLPAIRVDCPACRAPAGLLCTSHGGRRELRNNVHRARTAAWKNTQKGGGR